MERLTERDKYTLSHGEEIIICNYKEEDCNDSCMSILPCKWKKQVEEKLWEYENAEEQGMLIKLPCKVGDTVYVKMQYGGYAKGEIRDFTHFVTCGFCVVVTSEKFDKINIPFSEFGKSIFFTEPQE